MGPHQGAQPVDIRECGYVTSFGPKYVHSTYPMERTVGCEAILEAEELQRTYTKHLAASLMETRGDSS